MPNGDKKGKNTNKIDKITGNCPISQQLTENVDLNDLSFVWNKFNNRPSKVTFYSSFEADDFWSLLIEKMGIIEDKNKYSTCDVVATESSVVYNYKYLIKISDDIYLSLYEFLNDSSHSISNLSFYYNNENVTIDVVNDYINILSMSLIVSESSRVNYMIFDQGKLELEPVENKFEYINNGDDDFLDSYPDKMRLKMDKLIKNIDKKKNGIYTIYGENNKDKKSYLGYLIDQIDKNIVIIPYNIVETFLSSLELTEVLNLHSNTLFIVDDADGLFYGNSGLNGLIQVINGTLKKYVSANFLFSYNSKKEGDIPTKIVENSSNIIKFEYKEKSGKGKGSSYY